MPNNNFIYRPKPKRYERDYEGYQDASFLLVFLFIAVAAYFLWLWFQFHATSLFHS